MSVLNFPGQSSVSEKTDSASGSGRVISGLKGNVRELVEGSHIRVYRERFGPHDHLYDPFFEALSATKCVEILSNSSFVTRDSVLRIEKENQETFEMSA